MDAVNEGRDTVRLGVENSFIYDQGSILQQSTPPNIDMDGRNSTDIPPGITTGWTVNFRRPADLIQVFELAFDVDNQRHYRLFRDMQLMDGPPPEVKTFAPTSPIGEDCLYEFAGLQFAFKGCTGQDAPKCVTDVRNTTDDYVRINIRRTTAQIQGEGVRPSRQKIEMTDNNSGQLPPGVTTSLIYEFSQATAEFESLPLAFTVDGDVIDRVLETVPVQ